MYDWINRRIYKPEWLAKVRGHLNGRVLDVGVGTGFTTGHLADAQGRPFTFNQEVPRFHGVIAVAAMAGRELRQLLQAHADQARTKRTRS